ncbi:hypothetical protein ACQJ2V_26055, partial [Klebsiella variicola subsp. variicola]|uniref:hypothetical protein n=1 Tax=Klebsiella variicola TaxID=244366 RepID=UPI003D06F2F4
RRNTDSTIIWPGSQKMHGTKTGLFTPPPFRECRSCRNSVSEWSRILGQGQIYAYENMQVYLVHILNKDKL